MQSILQRTDGFAVTVGLDQGPPQKNERACVLRKLSRIDRAWDRSPCASEVRALSSRSLEGGGKGKACCPDQNRSPARIKKEEAPKTERLGIL